MPQLHLHVLRELAAEIARKARARGVSVSRYLADLVRREVCGGSPGGYFDEVPGGWVGEPLERPDQGAYELREELWKEPGLRRLRKVRFRLLSSRA